MNVRVIVLLFSLWQAALAFSQNVTFQKVVGTTAEEKGISVIRTSFGEYVTAALSWDSTMRSKVLLVKFSSTGSVIWANYYFSYSDSPVQLIETSDQNFVVAGTADSCAASADIFLLKIDGSTGALIWSRSYSGPGYDMAFSLSETSDSGFVIGGFYTQPMSNPQSLVIKTDSQGNIQWSKLITLGGGGGRTVVKQSPTGNYFVSGYYGNTTSSSMDMFLVKLDPAGNLLWARSYGSVPNYDEGIASFVESPGGYIYAAGTRSTNAVYGELLICRISPTGGLLWARSFGGSAFVQQEWGRDLSLSDGIITAVGLTNSFSPGQNFYVVSCDTLGNMAGEMTYSGAEAWSVAATAYGGYVICGYTSNTTFGSSDIYLVKTDSAYSSGCQESPVTDTAQIVNLSSILINPAITNPLITSSACQYRMQPAFQSDSTLCLTVGVAEETQIPELLLYPNPSHGILTLKTTRAFEKGNAGIYNILGEEVISFPFVPGEMTLNCSSLSKGIYIIRILAGSMTYHKIFIID